MPKARAERKGNKEDKQPGPRGGLKDVRCHSCLPCNKVYTRKEHLERHRRKKHDREPFVKCAECDHHYNPGEVYESHVRNEHPTIVERAGTLIDEQSSTYDAISERHPSASPFPSPLQEPAMEFVQKQLTLVTSGTQEDQVMGPPKSPITLEVPPDRRTRSITKPPMVQSSSFNLREGSGHNVQGFIVHGNSGTARSCFSGLDHAGNSLVSDGFGYYSTSSNQPFPPSFPESSTPAYQQPPYTGTPLTHVGYAENRSYTHATIDLASPTSFRHPPMPRSFGPLGDIHNSLEPAGTGVTRFRQNPEQNIHTFQPSTPSHHARSFTYDTRWCAIGQQQGFKQALHQDPGSIYSIAATPGFGDQSRMSPITQSSPSSNYLFSPNAGSWTPSSHIYYNSTSPLSAQAGTQQGSPQDAAQFSPGQQSDASNIGTSPPDDTSPTRDQGRRPGRR